MLRARRMIEYFCPRCQYVTTTKPTSDTCPACGDNGTGKSQEDRQWTGKDRGDTTVTYDDPLDQDRADSMENGS